MEKKENISGNISRRKLLKKVGIAAVFVIPTLITFSTSELQATSSGHHGGGGGGGRRRRWWRR
jgi:hypothetical protein